MPPTGEGRRGVLIVAEAPGKLEDRRGEQLIGDAGQVLRKALRKIDIDLDRDCWKTNSIICRPPSNRTPTPKELGYCFPFLNQTIEDLNPKVIILLGLSPVKSLIGRIWKSEVGSLERWVGQQIPAHNPNAWICPTYHPSYVLRTSQGNRDSVAKVIFERNLKEAFSLEDRPWSPSPPIFKDRVRLIFSPYEAARAIRLALSFNPRTITFDFETNRIKPDHLRAEIVCASFHFEKGETIAFPWQGEAIEAAKIAIESPIPKIAANLKFEDRWCRRFGIKPRRWVWDTMLNGHIINNARGATGLKFQSFVLLGQPDYDSHLHSFLHGFSKGNQPNKIHLIDMRDLLLYCGMDSLLEFLVAKKQSEKLGVPLC